ncbi:umecyanin-like [Momordica charantia]|uniref:Umecyanin-like n=1 Tax=Momordica charantia TaxID=3673 RepID=A0A6J1CSQ4_MOMCH|nr:umecyanin-like [Momordica charantia]
MSCARMSSMASLFFFIVALLHAVAAVDHHVGGDFGWNLPPTPTFFSDWARNRTFFVGDTLRFNSSANETHNFAQPPSQSEFDGCVDPGIVFDPRLFITFNRPGRLYFICTVGNHCKQGMKFAVDVLATPGTTPTNAAALFTVPPLPSLFFAAILLNLLFFV